MLIVVCSMEEALLATIMTTTFLRENAVRAYLLAGLLERAKRQKITTEVRI